MRCEWVINIQAVLCSEVVWHTQLKWASDDVTFSCAVLRCAVQIGAYEQIAARVQAAVDQNCGQKAVILAHSMGASVILRMLREPRFQAWK